MCAAYFNRRQRGNRRQCGAVLVLTAITLIVLIGLVGLAIDGGRGYGVKARLSAAVDAASIAGARALSEGATNADRIANAEDAARRYFTLNYPNDYLGSTPGELQTEALSLENGRWQVTVSGTAVMPTTFMRVLGQNEMDVGGSGRAIRRDLDVMLVMDTSGSLKPPTSPATVFPALKTAAKEGFIAKFVDGPGGDRVGVVSFASGAVLDAAINKTAVRGFDRAAVNARITALTSDGATATAEGMRKGLDELNAIPANIRSSLRVILLFSDGAPNTVNGVFPWTSYDSRGRVTGSGNVTGNLYSELASSGNNCSTATRAYRWFPQNQRAGNETSNCNITSLPNTGSGGVLLQSAIAGQRALATSGGNYTNSRCNVNKAARNMVETLAYNARSQGIVVFAIGLGASLQGIEMGGCNYAARERGEAVLKRIANTSDSTNYVATQPTGQYCFAQDETQLNQCFARIASEILRLVL